MIDNDTERSANLKQVDWTKWSAIAEIFGAIAILFTLAYLAIQTRYLAVQTEQNTAAVQAAVRQSMITDDRELIFQQMAFPVVAPGTYNRDLTREEEVQVLSWIIAFIRVRENHWLQYQNGVVDEATWATYRTPLRVILSEPLAREYWQESAARGEFERGFIDDVNDLLADVPVRSSASFRQAIGLEP